MRISFNSSFNFVSHIKDSVLELNFENHNVQTTKVQGKSGEFSGSFYFCISNRQCFPIILFEAVFHIHFS